MAATKHMQNTHTGRNTMTLTLIDREHSNKTQWITERPGYFIAHHSDGEELWESHRPYAVNERLHKFDVGYAPTLEDIDEVLSWENS